MMHGDTEGTSSGIKIFGNIFISFIGAGILGLPYAFMEAGLIEGVIVMSLVGVISVKAMLLLIDCKDKILKESRVLIIKNGRQEQDELPPPAKVGITHIDYGELGFAAYGSAGKVVVDFSIIVSQIGFNCAYLIFISENFYSIFPRIPKLIYLFLLLVPLCFLCNLRHLAALAPFSLFADFANVFAYSIVFYFDLRHLHLVHSHVRSISLDGLPFFLGVAIYCYEGAGMVLSLEQSVIKDYRNTFRSIFKLVLFLVTLLYIVFGVMGYLSFGPYTQSIITLNLPPGPFPLIVKSCLCLSLFFTYPMMMFPVSEILEKRISCVSFSPSHFTGYLSGCILRILLVLVTGIIVLLIPNFSILMALVGSSCCTLLAFILPAVFHVKLFGKNIARFQFFFDILLILIGLIGAVIGTQDALSRLFSDKTTSLHTINNTIIN
ncbi:PREDICTED: amino acid transporter ANT1-like [Amphimedon queenslandica]|uniref:Amino acid transporter transmembrane domain-containing protein n=1 Tax=Amphimedon queenslandica TaxID=400682 RepID=A0A1X7U875_AMPQE|nr:PREDICTED: amino acid transporter ANT1-like [Amphimedon queenslandica]|eukprot:XP_003388735.3 PREDICTED: amino acid transporter ANT1-like [Amphimedon queenslandica]